MRHRVRHGRMRDCSVIIDNGIVLYCTILAFECAGKKIKTIEGIAADSKRCSPATSLCCCCCGTYPRHPTAIMEATQVMKGGS
jgi:hypothetical protein